MQSSNVQIRCPNCGAYSTGKVHHVIDKRNGKSMEVGCGSCAVAIFGSIMFLFCVAGVGLVITLILRLFIQDDTIYSYIILPIDCVIVIAMIMCFLPIAYVLRDTYRYMIKDNILETEFSCGICAYKW